MKRTANEHVSSSGSPRLHIGVAGPATVREFAADLNEPGSTLPAGLSGTPVDHLVRAWLDDGHCVTLATLDRTVPVGESVTYTGPYLTIVVGPYRDRHRARDAFAVERRAIRDALARHRPNAVSAHWTYEFALGAIETGLPTIVTVHDVPKVIFSLQPSMYRLIRWGMHRRALARATGVVFNSPYTRQTLAHPQHTNAPVIPNALPDSAWHLQERSAPDPSRPSFISVNNGFGHRKNVQRLIKAFQLVRMAIPGACLHLIGTGFEPGGTAHQWSRAHASEDGIEFQGPLEYRAVLDRVRAADVLVHPALEESFGYTLIEAASVGTPVIGGMASGAVPWVLADGASGLLVDVTSSELIAAAMRSLASEPVRWRQLRLDAFEAGRKRFTASRIGRDYVDILEGISSASPSRIG